MSTILHSIEQVLSLLAATPPRLAGLTDDPPPAQLLASPEPGGWSARDVVAHLQTYNDVWGKYLRMIIAKGSLKNPVLACGMSEPER